MAREHLKKPRSTEEAQKWGAAGGRASGAARREKRNMRQRLEILLQRKVGDMETADAVTIALIEKALSGDVRAYEVIRDTIGEKPADNVNTNNNHTIDIFDVVMRAAKLNHDEKNI